MSGNKEAHDRFPVAIIGAGPVGLAGAAMLSDRGIEFTVIEQADRVGAHLAEWGHVRLFTPWSMNVDPVSGSLLEASGWDLPDADAHPTGAQWREQYLEPLAELSEIAPRLRLGTRVVTVSRVGLDKGRSNERSAGPFRLVVETGGHLEEILASAVIDASGTWATPNPLGGDGVPAFGEQELANRLHYGIPDVLGSERRRFEGRSVAVVGSGHSAQQVVRDLVRLADEAPGPTITWIVRRPQMIIGEEPAPTDPLPARAALADALRSVVESGRVRVVSGFWTRRVEHDAGQLVLTDDDERRLGPFDEAVVSTGFRPDLGLLRELQVRLDSKFEAAQGIVTLIDPDEHTCGTVPVHGWRELAHPEPDLWVVGMKSYGRAPTFLASTGYAQVRSIIDRMTAQQVHESPPAPEPQVSCCAPVPADSGGCSVPPGAAGTLVRDDIP